MSNRSFFKKLVLHRSESSKQITKGENGFVFARTRSTCIDPEGRESIAVQNFAEAIGTVPVTPGEKAELDPIDLLSGLRARHEKGEKWAGIDVLAGEITDMKGLDVYEPIAVKKQVIKSATEAVSIILKIYDVIASGKDEDSIHITSWSSGWNA